jgi:hypothetical protein
VETGDGQARKVNAASRDLVWVGYRPSLLFGTSAKLMTRGTSTALASGLDRTTMAEMATTSLIWR